MKRDLVEDEDKWCGCCGNYPVMSRDGYHCELCYAARHGTSDDLAKKYYDELDHIREGIANALGYIDTMHETWCEANKPSELYSYPCVCSRSKVMKILEDLL